MSGGAPIHTCVSKKPAGWHLEIDRHLYDRHAPERHFIEAMIKPMG